MPLAFAATHRPEIDGREKRAGEPSRRRNDSGDIQADLAVIRSFVYPQISDVLDIAASLAGTSKDSPFFNHPPNCMLVMGGMSVEGFLTDLKITETAFNSDLNPTRAEVEITMIENIDSISFIVGSFKRLGRMIYNSAYEDIGDVLF